MTINQIREKIKENYFTSYIYLYIFLMPWNFLNGQMGALSTILLVWWLIRGEKNGYFSKLKSILTFKPLLLIILFFLYSYLSLLWTENIEASTASFKFYKYYWILIPVLFTSLTKEEAKNGIHIFLLSLGSYAVFSILLFLDLVHIIDRTHENTPNNPRGILAYAIITPYMAIGFLSSIFIAYYSKLKSVKMIFFITAALSFIGLFINNGRAGQLAFFITLIVLLITYRKYLINIKFLVATLLTLTVSIYMLNQFGELDRFKVGFQNLQNVKETNFKGSWGERAYMWYAAAYIIKKDPIFGVGAGDNIDKFIEYTKINPSSATWLRSFHNQHLDTLTRYGIFGYSLLWGSVLWLLFYLKEYKLYFALGLVFFSITYFDGLGDIILLMKPYNNIFMLIFLLLSVIVYNNKYSNLVDNK